MTTKGNRPYQPYPPRPQLELQNRKILLGVTGGIAAYKAAELCRLLIKAGAKVQVVMTRAAEKFIAPLTFETITGRSVFIEMFPEQGEQSPWHTEMATWADVAVIAPATANHMAKLAHGLADDLLSTLMLTIERPRVLCPAMNPRMWANHATQSNLVSLKQLGYRVMMPEDGQMARPGEEEGVGRLADPESIYREIRHILSAPQDLRGVRVLVTAGRTEESWDPVRVLTNRASGRMGFALAEEARERGAEVMLIHGPTDVIPPTGVRIQKITTAQEMAQAVKREFPHCNILLMSAAVADYTFSNTAEHKIKKGQPDPEMKLVATEDILRGLSANKGSRVIVGFALETENLLENALKKLREKHMDVVVANNPLERGSGFSGDTNQVMIIHRTGRVQDLPLQSKREVAREILHAVISLYRHPEPEPEVEPDFDLEPEIELDDPLDDADSSSPVTRESALDIDDDDDDDMESDATAMHVPSAPRPFENRDRDGKPESRSARRRRNKKRRLEQQRNAQEQRPPAAPVIAAESANGHKPESQTVAPAPVAVEQKPANDKKNRRGGKRVREREAKKAMQEQQAQIPLEPLPRPRVTVRPAPQKSTPLEMAAPPPPPVVETKAEEAPKKRPGKKPAATTKAKQAKPAAKPKTKPATAKPAAAKKTKKPAKKKAEVEA